MRYFQRLDDILWHISLSHSFFIYIGIRYRCMGSWYAVKNGVGYIFAAVGAVVEADIREKFKCMVRTNDRMGLIKY